MNHAYETKSKSSSNRSRPKYYTHLKSKPSNQNPDLNQISLIHTNIRISFVPPIYPTSKNPSSNHISIYHPIHISLNLNFTV